MVSSDYNNKHALQYLLFPDGLLYSKQNDTVRTPKVNALFQTIPLLARISGENKKSRFRKNGQNSHWVVPTGIPSSCHFFSNFPQFLSFLVNAFLNFSA